MAVTELVRMLFAVNAILEEASAAVNLSKRAALALAILHLEESSDETMTNQDLHDRFVKHNVSTGLSAKKDSSAAKGELLAGKYIEIRGKVSVFALTSKGRDAVSKMYDAMDKAMEKLGLSEEERSVLRGLVKLPSRKPPASETAGKPVRRKSP